MSPSDLGTTGDHPCPASWSRSACGTVTRRSFACSRMYINLQCVLNATRHCLCSSRSELSRKIFTIPRELRRATALETVRHTTRKVTPMIRRMHKISTSRYAGGLSAVALAALLTACSQSASTAAVKPAVSAEAHPDLPEIVITASRSHNAPEKADLKSARVRSRAMDNSS